MKEKILYIDADTLLYQAAAKEEINKCLATNTLNGKSKMFESKTAFNEWHKTSSQHPKEAYTFEVVKEQVGEAPFAFRSVRDKITNIVLLAEEAYNCVDYRVCIQGKDNYRKYYKSDFVAYKGQRQEKPLLLADVQTYVKRKYGDRCVVVDGEETDDFICKTAWKHWNPEGSIEDSGVLISFVDKDIVQNSPGAMLNYMQLESGAFWNTLEMQYKGFWGSTLMGDAADNIDGILHLADETKKKYGIKTGGCGKVAAARILSTVESEKDAAERVLEAYRLAWPDDYFQRLQDMCFFLWLRREDGEMFDLKKYLDKLKVELRV